jgi:hypothetical protein
MPTAIDPEVQHGADMRARTVTFLFFFVTCGSLQSAAVSAQSVAQQFASDNLANDRWGVYDVDFAWDTRDAGHADWSVEDDWPTYGTYYTEDFRSGYGGAYGAYDWGTGEWQFSEGRNDVPLARRVEWRSDRFGVYESGYAWETDSIGFGPWSERSRGDWLGYTDAGDQGWFDF